MERETCKRAPLETAGARVSNGPRALAGVSRGRSTESNEPGNTGGPHNSGRAELGRQNTTIGGLVPGAMKPIGRALGSDHRGRERVTALSVRTARNRRTRTRMSGGVGGGGRNPPADPIRSHHLFPLTISWTIRLCFLSSSGVQKATARFKRLSASGVPMAARACNEAFNGYQLLNPM